MNIGKCRSLIDIEQVLSKLEAKAEGERFIVTLDNLKARHGSMHDASRLQMLVTLARRHLQSEHIDIHPNASRESAIEAICDYSPGIAAARITAGIRLGEVEFGRREVLSGAIDKMHDTDFGNFNKVIKGRCLDLICVSGSKVQYLRPLFAAKEVVKEHTAMRDSMKQMADFVNKGSANKIPNKLIDALGLFSTELIKNTQEHAITDHAGHPYIEHVEGMILGWKRLDDELFAEDFLGNKRLEEYWQSEVSTTDTGKTSLRVFEVSYFDSGPGFVGRLKGQPVTDFNREEERKFLLECFKHKVTTKSEDAAGEGLSTVLRELKEIGGMIRIRTGRHSIFNAFIKDDPQRELFDFEDWSDKPLAEVEGTVLSLLIPLRAE